MPNQPCTDCGGLSIHYPGCAVMRVGEVREAYAPKPAPPGPDGSPPAISAVWIREREFTEGKHRGAVESFELRLDFHNDRHHALDIKAGWTAKEISTALLLLAYALEGDHSLD
jgi:hypothetical protein